MDICDTWLGNGRPTPTHCYSNIDTAYVREGQKIASRQKLAAAVAKTVGVSGAAAAGVHYAHELMGQ